MDRGGFILLNVGIGTLVLFCALMAVIAADALTAGDLGGAMAWLIAAGVVMAGAFLQARFVVLLAARPDKRGKPE